jgi:hypothetical protein
VNAVMNLRVPKNDGKLSSGYTTGGLSSSAQLRVVRNAYCWLITSSDLPAPVQPAGASARFR